MSELFFKRLAQRELATWRGKDGARPLIVRGPPGCGKSTLLADLAAKTEEELVISLNLKRDVRAMNSLTSSTDPESMLNGLVKGKEGLDTERALLVVDHIPADKARLILEGVLLLHQRYRNIHIIASGAFGEEPFESGLRSDKFIYSEVSPLSFGEYLAAVGKEELARPVLAAQETQSEPTHHRLCDEFETFLTVGGIPEVVRAFVGTRALSDAAEAQRAYLARVRPELATGQFGDCVNSVWRALIANHGERFDLPGVALEFPLAMRKRAVDLLGNRYLFRKVVETVPQSGGLPPAQQQRGLRAIVCDAGLLRIGREDLRKGPMRAYEPASLEDRVVLDQSLAQDLNYSQRGRIYSWTSSVRGSSSRVDFVIDVDSKPYPIILVGGGADPAKQNSSMNIVLDTYPECPAGIFFSMDRQVGWSNHRELRLPLYMALSATTRGGLAALMAKRPPPAKKGAKT
jgi:hypothetical protein